MPPPRTTSLFRRAGRYCFSRNSKDQPQQQQRRLLAGITVTKAPENNTSSNKMNTGSRPAPSSAPADGNLFQEPIHILGAGSIGMLLAASIRFTFPSYPVKLILRDKPEYQNVDKLSICLRQTFEQPQQDDNGTRSNTNRTRMVHVPCETTTGNNQRAARRRKPIRHLILTTKAFSAVAAVESVVDRIVTIAAADAAEDTSTDNDDDDDPDSSSGARRSSILVLCNGALAVQQELSEWLVSYKEQQQQQPSSPPLLLPTIRVGILTHGAYREQQQQPALADGNDAGIQHVVHAGYGSCVLESNGDDDGMAILLDMAGLNCTTASGADADADTTSAAASMQRLLWNKLAANCVINPLTALHRCRNGQLWELPRFRSHYYPSILREVAHVYVASATTSAAAAENSLEENTTRQQASLQLLIDQAEAEFRDYVDTVLRDTASNKSSMLQDIDVDEEQAMIRTEVDYLSGYVVRTGAAHGVACPVNQELWEKVRALHQQ